MAKGQGSKAATVVTSQDLVQPLVAVSVQSAQLRQKLQAVHDEYQKKQLHLVRQLAASTTTVSSSVQGGYNCRVSCFELDMLDFRKLQAVHDEYQKKQLHLVRQLAVSTTTVPSSVQGGYNCRVSCFELGMLDFRKLQAVFDEYQEKHLHLFSPPTGCQYHHCF